MPKPFMLGIEVEEIALGKVMRVLNNMPGIVKLHMDLSLPNGGKRPYKKRGEILEPPGRKKTRHDFNITGEEFILIMLEANPATTAQMRTRFAEAGRSPHSINSALFGLKDKDMVVRNNKTQQWIITSKGKKEFDKNKERDGVA